MKKAKVIRRSGAPEGRVLKPSRMRMFIIYTVVFALAIVFGFLIRWVTNPSAFGKVDWVMLAVVVLGGAVVMAFLEQPRWTLRVLDGGKILEGTTGAFGARKTLPIQSIDWAVTHRSLSSWVKIGNAISMDRSQRLMISPWFFNPQELDDFLRAIGYQPPE